MKIAIIGAGNMGGAIARGLAHGNLDVKIAVADLAQDKLAELNVECNCVETSTDSNAIVADADVVLVAVKPWLVEPVLKGALPLLDLKRQIILSIAAGVDIATITEWLGDENAIVFRAIPNTAISIHQSMTFVSHSKNAESQQVAQIESIFNTLGKAAVIEERLMGAATSLCSCGIAYAMRYVRAATEGGVELGIYPNDAKQYVLQTLRGAIELLEATGNNPEVEIDKVTTPGGITIKGLNAMEANGFTTAVIEGLKASR
ncbi:MAG: pyrroline-5-carboxylate reductase [Muribaculaceae bacterium]|nr:pyrroline-5-carboxylate reductase [Muribaculaceae bacterium]